MMRGGHARNQKEDVFKERPRGVWKVLSKASHADWLEGDDNTRARKEEKKEKTAVVTEVGQAPDSGNGNTSYPTPRCRMCALFLKMAELRASDFYRTHPRYGYARAQT